jgi:hypothetical protein
MIMYISTRIFSLQYSTLKVQKLLQSLLFRYNFLFMSTDMSLFNIFFLTRSCFSIQCIKVCYNVSLFYIITIYKTTTFVKILPF